MRLFSLLVCTSLPLFAQNVSRPRVLGIAHMALYVSDVEKSRAFYRDFLGFGEPLRANNPDGSLARTFIKINDNQYVELVPGLEPGADRLHHIAIYTDDAEAMRVWLASRGVKVPDRVRKGRYGDLRFSVRDPEGHTVEFVQYEPDGWAMRGKGKFLSDSRVSTRMMHLGILVGDVEAALRFYGDILGFRETWRGSSSGKELSWINMKVPDGEDYIEFMLYKELPPPDRRGSAHHICLETPDLARALAALKADPYRETYTRSLEPRVGTNRRRQLNLFDPDGTRVELMEPRTIDGKPVPSSTAPPPWHSLP